MNFPIISKTKASDLSNLIPNGSFEITGANGAPAGWSQDSWGINQSNFTYPVPGIDGGNAAKVDMTSYTSGDAKWTFGDIPATPGQTYTFSDSYIATVPTTIEVRYLLINGNYTYDDIVFPSISDTWQSSTSTFTVPAGVKSFTIYQYLDNVGSLTVDNFSLIANSIISPPPSSSGGNLINNGSFDSVGADGLPAGWTEDKWGINQSNFTYSVPGIDGGNAAKVDMTSYTSGDAKWTFGDIPATPGQTYTFSDSYIATVPTTLEIRYTLSGGYYSYIDFPQSASNAWKNSTTTFVVPTGVQSLNIYQYLDSAGSLTTDNFYLSTSTPSPPPSPPAATNTDNLIFNPSLSLMDASSGLPQGWYKGNWGVNQTTFTYPVAGFNNDDAAKISISSYTSGASRWYFKDVAVIPGHQYQFSDYYTADTSTAIIARVHLADGTYSYLLLSRPGASISPAVATSTFIAPANSQSVTILHSLVSVGSLTTGEFNLNDITSPTPPPPPPTSTDNLIKNPSFEIADSATGLPQNWYEGGWGVNTPNFIYPVSGVDGTNSKAAEIDISSYTNGDAKWYFSEVNATSGDLYEFSDKYMATAQNTVEVALHMSDGTYQYQTIASPTLANNWNGVDVKFAVPSGTKTITIFHSLTGVGSLKVDDYYLKDLGNNPYKFSEGMVSLNFDDGDISAYQTAFPILKQANLSGTFYIITNTLNGNYTDYVNAAQVLDMQSQGMEIGSHTIDHSHLPQLSYADQQNEITGSWDALNSIGINVTTFAYPFGEYDATSVQILKNSGLYVGARTTQSGFNDKSTDHFLLKYQEAVNTTTLAQFENWINQSIADKTWLVLVFHRVDSSNDNYAITPALFQQIVDYIAQTGVKVVTNDYGIKMLNPQ